MHCPILTSPQPHEIELSVIPILQMKKLSLRVVGDLPSLPGLRNFSKATGKGAGAPANVSENLGLPQSLLKLRLLQMPLLSTENNMGFGYISPEVTHYSLSCLLPIHP